MYAAVGVSKDTIQVVGAGCGEKVSLPAMQSVYINMILAQGKEQIKINVNLDPGSSKLPIIIGSAVGAVVIISLGIFCYIKKRNQNLRKQYEKLNEEK